MDRTLAQADREAQIYRSNRGRRGDPVPARRAGLSVATPTPYSSPAENQRAGALTMPIAHLRLSTIGTIVLLLGALGSCATTAGIHAPASGEPIRVTLYMNSQGQRFELVNPAHTDPIELYSSSRSSAGVKVTDDDVLLEIVDYLSAEGYGEREAIGRAPAGGMYSLAFEVETANGTSHWGTNQKVSAPEDLAAMNRCVRYFLNEKFNRVQAFQTMKNREGGGYFKDTPVRKPGGTFSR